MTLAHTTGAQGGDQAARGDQSRSGRGPQDRRSLEQKGSRGEDAGTAIEHVSSSQSPSTHAADVTRVIPVWLRMSALPHLTSPQLELRLTSPVFAAQGGQHARRREPEVARGGDSADRHAQKDSFEGARHRGGDAAEADGGGTLSIRVIENPFKHHALYPFVMLLVHSRC